VAEFVIVGGGVIGCATAWELARRGAGVVLLEANRLASGASGGPGKRGVRSNRRDERELPLARLATEIWPALAGELGAPIGYERIGELELFEREGTRAAAERIVDLQRRHGIRTDMLDARGVRELEPDVSESVVGATFCPDDAVADQTATTRAYAEAARRAGADIREATAVQALHSEEGAVRELHTAGGAIAVDRAVLVAANQATKKLVDPLGAELHIFPVLPQVLFTDGTAGVEVRHLVGHLERRLALKPAPNGLQISGGWLGRWSETTDQPEVLADHVAGNLADAVATYPGLKDVRVQAACADRVESVGLELIPTIDRVPRCDRVFVAAGWTGHGFAIAPAVARLLSRWMLDGDRPVELAPFAWR
jgi:sarcosine oxidase subunit beta